LKLLIDSQPDMKVIAEASDGQTPPSNGAVALKPERDCHGHLHAGDETGSSRTRTLKKLQPGAANP